MDIFIVQYCKFIRDEGHTHTYYFSSPEKRTAFLIENKVDFAKDDIDMWTVQIDPERIRTETQMEGQPLLDALELSKSWPCANESGKFSGGPKPFFASPITVHVTGVIVPCQKCQKPFNSSHVFSDSSFCPECQYKSIIPLLCPATSSDTR